MWNVVYYLAYASVASALGFGVLYIVDKEKARDITQRISKKITTNIKLSIILSSICTFHICYATQPNHHLSNSLLYKFVDMLQLFSYRAVSFVDA